MGRHNGRINCNSRTKLANKEKRIKRDLAHQNDCFNFRSLELAIKNLAGNMVKVINHISIAARIQKKRIAATVIEWLREMAITYKEAYELLKFVAP